MRNFIRRFKESTAAPVQNLHIEKAKHLLESSEQAFEQITY